jgi:hypothetical protein
VPATMASIVKVVLWHPPHLQPPIILRLATSTASERPLEPDSAATQAGRKPRKQAGRQAGDPKGVTHEPQELALVHTCTCHLPAVCAHCKPHRNAAHTAHT